MKYIKYIFTFLSLILSISYLASCGDKVKADGYYQYMISDEIDYYHTYRVLTQDKNEELKIVNHNYNYIADVKITVWSKGKAKYVFDSKRNGYYIDRWTEINTGYILKKNKRYLIEFEIGDAITYYKVGDNFYSFSEIDNEITFSNNTIICVKGEPKEIYTTDYSDIEVRKTAAYSGSTQDNIKSITYYLLTTKHYPVTKKMNEYLVYEFITTDGGVVEDEVLYSGTLAPYEKRVYTFNSTDGYLSYNVSGNINLKVITDKELEFDQDNKTYLCREGNGVYEFCIINSSNEEKEFSFMVDDSYNMTLNNGESAVINVFYPIYVNFTPSESGYYYSKEFEFVFKEPDNNFAGYVYLEKGKNYRFELYYYSYVTAPTRNVNIDIIKIDDNSPYRMLEIEEDCKISLDIKAGYPWYRRVEILRNGEIIMVENKDKEIAVELKKGDLLVYFYGNDETGYTDLKFEELD